MEEIEIGRDCTLKVKNFLCLKDVECEFKGINVLIGPQAEGKSLIAKLVFFFQEFLRDTIYENFLAENDVEELYYIGPKFFGEYFPGKAWHKQKFTISYLQGPIKITLKNSGNSVSLRFGNVLRDLLYDIEDSIKSEREFFIDNLDETEEDIFDISPFIPSVFQGPPPVYVPAQRNIISVLHESIFTNLHSGGSIDRLLTSYGSKFEIHNKQLIRLESRKRNLKSPFLNRWKTIHEYIKPIIKGEYVLVEKTPSIATRHGVVKLSDASSGQQELLPIFPALTRWCGTAFIEEPEAHVYPSSQKEIIKLFAYAYNMFPYPSSIIITTHSPYVLTTINNLLAATTAALKKKANKRKVNEIIPEEFWLSYSDTSAWYVNEGTATSIMDSESQLMDANAIDDVSDQLAKEFDELLDIQYGE